MQSAEHLPQSLHPRPFAQRTNVIAMQSAVIGAAVRQGRLDDRRPASAAEHIQPRAVGGFVATSSAPRHYDAWHSVPGCRGISPGCPVVAAPTPRVGPGTRSARTQNGWCRPGTASSVVDGSLLAIGMQFALRIAHLLCPVHAQPFQRQCGSGNVSAQPLHPVTLVWRTRYRRIQREAVSRHRERFWHTRCGYEWGEFERQDLTPGM